MPERTMDMDIASLFQALPPGVQTGFLLILIGSYVISHVISNTATPAPNTAWGRIYRYLELFSGIYNQAKAIGIPTPTVADLQASLGKVIRDATAAGRDNVDLVHLAQAVGVPLDPPAPSTAPSQPTISAQPSVTMALALALLSAASLMACTSSGDLTPEAERALKIGCVVNGTIKPIVEAGGEAVADATGHGAEADAILAVDAKIDPAIQRACASLGGTMRSTPQADSK